MQKYLRTTWAWWTAASMSLAVSTLCAAQGVEAESNHDDRLTKLAQQLALPSVEVASPAASVDAPAPSAAVTPVASNEQLPLLRADRPDDVAASSPSPRLTWGSHWVLNTVTALGVVLLVIFGLRALLTRLGAAKGAGSGGGGVVIEVLNRTMIAPRNNVLLLRVGGRVLVVSDSSAGLRTLAQIDDPAEIASIFAATSAASPQSITQGFSQMLGRFNRDFDDRDRAAAEGNDDAEHTIDRARDRVSGLLTRMRSLSSREAPR